MSFWNRGLNSADVVFTLPLHPLCEFLIYMYVYMMTTTLQFFVWRNFMSIWYCAKFEKQFWANWHRQKYRKLSMRLATAFNKWILQQLCRCLDYAFAVCPHRFISTVVVAEGQGNTTRHCITLLPVRPRRKLWINSAQWQATLLHYIMVPSCVWKYCLNCNMLTTITYTEKLATGKNPISLQFLAATLI